MTAPERDHHEPDFLQNLRTELGGIRHWLERGLVLGYAVLAGLFTVGFTVASDWGAELFDEGRHAAWWAPLLWTPLLTTAIVWATRRFFPGASGSGIPQVMAAQDPLLPPAAVGGFVSLRLTLAKIGLSVAGLAAGLSIGREGPSVQVAAGVMHHARRWLRAGSGIDHHALLVAGGAAGMAATFNAPLAGVVFAIEELSRRLESRSSGLIITAIVLAGLVAVSAFGNVTYFGIIYVPRLTAVALVPGLVVTLLAGLLGGLFSRLLLTSLTNTPQRLNRWRARFPLRFAAGCGLGVAVMGVVTAGATFGAGSNTVKQMLAGESQLSVLYTPLKFMATWLTSWSGVPGGLFAPSLSIGAGIGHDVATLTSAVGGISPDQLALLAPVLIAVGMASFLAAVTQAPLTAFIIVMEMVDGHSMVLSLMASTMLASLVARMIARPLYPALAAHLVGRASATPAAAGDEAAPAAADAPAARPAPELPDTPAPR